MCVVSMIGDHYGHKWPQTYPWINTGVGSSNSAPAVHPTKAEFDALKKEVQEVKELLLKAKEYDRNTGQPNCDTEDKVALLKRIAEAVGVDLSEVFKSDD